MLIPIAKPDLSSLETRFVKEAIQSSWISSRGSNIELCEEGFSSLVKLPYVNLTSNGTTALQLVLASLSLSSDDEVIVPYLTFGAVPNAVIRSGLKPVFCGVDSWTQCVELQHILEVITPKTKAVVVVHSYGYPVKTDEIYEYCDKNNITVIEDWAEAIGATRDSSNVSKNKIYTFSFFANKILTAGEGGCVATDNELIDKQCRVLKNHGIKDRSYFHEYVGFNFRFNNLSAGVLLAQISRFQEMFEKRIILRNKIDEIFKNKVSFLSQNQSKNDNDKILISPWLYIIFGNLNNITNLKNILSSHEIETRISFTPLHLMPAYAKYIKSGNIKILEKYTSSYRPGLLLPLSSAFTSQEISYYLDSLKVGAANFD